MGAEKSKVAALDAARANGQRFNFNDPSSMRVAAWVLESSSYVHRLNIEDYPQRQDTNEKATMAEEISSHEYAPSCSDVFINLFRKLDHIQINQNLETFPCVVLNYKYLKLLDMHSNFIRSIPCDIRHLSNLEKLHLHDNMLTELPLEIGALTKLRVLTVDTNQIVSLPANIGNLECLLTLQVQDNLLTVLPQSLYLLRSLQDFRGRPSPQRHAKKFHSEI